MTVRTITEVCDVAVDTITTIRVGPDTDRGAVELEMEQWAVGERDRVRATRVDFSLEDARALVAGLTEAIRAAEEASGANDG